MLTAQSGTKETVTSRLDSRKQRRQGRSGGGLDVEGLDAPAGRARPGRRAVRASAPRRNDCECLPPANNITQAIEDWRTLDKHSKPRRKAILFTTVDQEKIQRCLCVRSISVWGACARSPQSQASDPTSRSSAAISTICTGSAWNCRPNSAPQKNRPCGFPNDASSSATEKLLPEAQECTAVCASKNTQRFARLFGQDRRVSEHSAVARGLRR